VYILVIHAVRAHIFGTICLVSFGKLGAIILEYSSKAGALHESFSIITKPICNFLGFEA